MVDALPGGGRPETGLSARQRLVDGGHEAELTVIDSRGIAGKATRTRQGRDSNQTLNRRRVAAAGARGAMESRTGKKKQSDDRITQEQPLANPDADAAAA